MDGEKNTSHAGHRQRVMKRIEREGLQCFTEHEVLELYLFGVIPRANTNPLSHRLIDKFGSLLGVFQASHDELLTVEGVGPRTADYINAYFKIMCDLVQQQFVAEKKININAFFVLLDLFITKKNDPRVHMLLTDSNGYFLGFIPMPDKYLSSGGKEILEYIRNFNESAKNCTFAVRDREKLTESFMSGVSAAFDAENFRLKNAFYRTGFGFKSYLYPDQEYHLYLSSGEN